MRETIPNVQLTAFRESRNWTRAELADHLNRSATGIKEGLACDEERIRRWERGEVLWPHSPYRRALKDVSGRTAESLGFVPPRKQKERRFAVAGNIVHPNALAAESNLFDTMELARMADASDIGQGAIETIQEAVELLCRAYPVTPAAALKERTKQRLKYVLDILRGRITLDQHRELLVQAGWLAALLGCLHYDLGEREPAEAARQAAFQMGRQAGHGEIMGWAYEMSAWFALTEGRYEDVVDAAQRGQAVAGTSNAMVQLTLQEAKGHARLGNKSESRDALERGAVILGKLPTPSRPDHHFVFDHIKWIFYAATIHAWQGDDDRAEEHAQEIIARHTRPDGTSNAPMRTANARIDLAIVNARRGELDAAVDIGLSAFDFDRKSIADLIARGDDLDQLLMAKYRREKLAQDFHERLTLARRALNEQRPELLG